MRKITLSICVLLIATLFSVNGQTTMSYSDTPLEYTQNTKITPIGPSFTGGTSEYGKVVTLQFIENIGVGGTDTTFIKVDQAQGLDYDPATKTLFFPMRSKRQVKKANMGTASPYRITAIAGDNTVAAGSCDGTGASALFRYPFDVAYRAGYLYVVDRNAFVVKKIDLATNVVTTYAGLADQSGHDDGGIGVAKLYNPAMLTFDESGNLYISAEQNPNKIRIVDAAQTTVSTLKDGTGTAMDFIVAFGMKYVDGYLYASERDARVISKTNLQTKERTDIAGKRLASGSFADGTGEAARFNRQQGIDLDGLGNIYVADYNNHRIRKVTPEGVVTTIAGDGTKASVDGTGATARFHSPTGLVLDGTGYLYCNDAGTSFMRKVSIVDFPGTTYSISPALPAGLSFNPNLGIISGTLTIASAAKDYTIFATTADNQPLASATINITIAADPSSSIKETKSIDNITVQFRNGQIEITGEVGENTFATVYNLQGVQLKEIRLENSGMNQINVVNLSKGIYLLNIQNASYRFNQKIVVN